MERINKWNVKDVGLLVLLLRGRRDERLPGWLGQRRNVPSDCKHAVHLHAERSGYKSCTDTRLRRHAGRIFNRPDETSRETVGPENNRNLEHGATTGKLFPATQMSPNSERLVRNILIRPLSRTEMDQNNPVLITQPPSVGWINLHTSTIKAFVQMYFTEL